MSEVGHITVRETHGIRRFLYPLSTEIRLPAASQTRGLGLVRQDGQPVPLQVSWADDPAGQLSRLDFALSLAPLETAKLSLCTDQPQVTLDDPLRIARGEPFRSVQRRFAIELGRHGEVLDVIYDNVRHLRAPGIVTRNGERALLLSTTTTGPSLPLAARVNVTSRYADGCKAHTRSEITACKSWMSLTHLLEEPRKGDELVFSLPLSVTSPVVTCDFGASGGIYSKLQAGSVDEVVWHTEFCDAGPVRWSLYSAGRLDYQGQVANSEAYLPQRWFHFVDRDKALAVAITRVPKNCRTMSVSLRAAGDVVVSFELGDSVAEPAVFGICYHFLNDIPPLSAATSPQSILLPPELWGLTTLGH
jgi:hypothetical protein